MGLCISVNRERHLIKLQYREQLSLRREYTRNLIKYSELLDHLDRYPNFDKYYTRKANYEQSLIYYKQQLDDITNTLQKTVDKLGSEWDLVLSRQITRMNSTIPPETLLRLDDLNSLSIATPTSQSSSINVSKTPTKTELSARLNMS